MKKISISILAMAACVGLAAARPRREATLVSGSDLKWVEVPNTGGVQVAPLWGDMTKTAHGMMVTFPAGAKHPLHTHTASTKLVVVSGAFTYGPEGGPEKTYGPGSYLMIPGGLRHSSGCTGAAPCVVFHDATGKFDYKPVAAKQ